MIHRPLLIVAVLTVAPLSGPRGATSGPPGPSVTFRLSLPESVRPTVDPTTLGVRGSVAPLSWERTLPLRDEEGDGVYTAVVSFPEAEAGQSVSYKFVHGEETWELEGLPDRRLRLEAGPLDLPVAGWNRYRSDMGADLPLPVIPAAQLAEDVRLMERAYRTLHPGLHRYRDEETLAAHLAALEKTVQRDLTLGEAYLAFSRFLAAIRCGHTYCNPWNQPGEVQQALFLRADKVPFTFRLVGRRMILTRNLSDDARLGRGVEILSIAGTPVDAVIEELMAVVRADGGNDAKRLDQMQLEGQGDHEAFDVSFPLLHPPSEGRYAVEARDLRSGERFTATVTAITRAERRERIEGRYGETPQGPDDLWEFRMIDDTVGYLRLGTFGVWEMSLDWRAFLKGAFDTLRSRKVPNLVVDIRGNEGGLDEVGAELVRHLVTRPIELPGRRWLQRYDKVPEDLRPHLGTWDEAAYDLTAELSAVEGGFFERRGASPEPRRLEPGPGAYRGRVYLLIGPANSSATFYLASMAKAGGFATLVGQPTGGNKRGTNGGLVFFLTLPHSRIEMDIPVVASLPLTPQPDEGVQPDVLVEPSVEDVLAGVDAELEAALALVRGAP